VSDNVGHYCGLFGVFGHPDAVELTYLALYAQQHRGEEAAGICSSDGSQIVRYTGSGLVTDVFDKRKLEQLRNPHAIGHVRYSTTGSSHYQNIQPFLAEYAAGQVAVAHNGNLINAPKLRHDYESRGHIFNTTSDTEVILHLLADPKIQNADGPLAEALRYLQGAFSLVFLLPDKVIAARDPYGIRPLCIGRFANGAYCFASETCALDIVDAEYIREVVPGEIVTIDEQGIRSRFFVDAKVKHAHCIFEMIYFADPASNVFGENVHEARRAMGKQLAREAPAEADVVIPVPNCARCAAQGYHEESGVEIGRGFTTSHYVGRSFIQPSQQVRDLVVKMKLNVIKPSVAGKRLVVVEDSVVRGTTTRGKMGALRKAGAKEIHLRVASPPIRHPCFYGIDFPSEKELIANGRTIEQIRDYLEVDSLAYLSLEGMLSVMKFLPPSYCTACFSGNYAIPVDHQLTKFALERHQMKMFE
jgi:amidophosphoribosyltransferase